jgi:hypothetical protein
VIIIDRKGLPGYYRKDNGLKRAFDRLVMLI